MVNTLADAIEDQQRLVDAFLSLTRTTANAGRVQDYVARSDRDGVLPYFRPFASPTALPLLPFVLGSKVWQTILDDLLFTCGGIRTIPTQVFGGDFKAYGRAH